MMYLIKDKLSIYENMKYFKFKLILFVEQFIDKEFYYLMILLFVLNSYFYKRIYGYLNLVFDVFRIVFILVVLKYGFLINLNSCL